MENSSHSAHSEAKNIATLSKLIKPLFVIIDGEKYVVINGTPIKYVRYVIEITSMASAVMTSYQRCPSNLNQKKYEEFKEMGFVVPDDFVEPVSSNSAPPFVTIRKWEDESYDAIISRFIIENLPNPLKNTEEFIEMVKDIEEQHEKHERMIEK